MQEEKFNVFLRQLQEHLKSGLDMIEVQLAGNSQTREQDPRATAQCSENGTKSHVQPAVCEATTPISEIVELSGVWEDLKQPSNPTLRKAGDADEDAAEKSLARKMSMKSVGSEACIHGEVDFSFLELCGSHEHCVLQPSMEGLGGKLSNRFSSVRVYRALSEKPGGPVKDVIKALVQTRFWHRSDRLRLVDAQGRTFAIKDANNNHAFMLHVRGKDKEYEPVLVECKSLSASGVLVEFDQCHSKISHWKDVQSSDNEPCCTRL
jgi:hypothetical protein